MIQIGRALRFNENYVEEVEFAQKLGFEFFQIWFYNGFLSAKTFCEEKQQEIKDVSFPIILHALFDIADYDKYGQRVIEQVDFFDHKEVIIHSVCTSEKITEKTVYKLKEKIGIIHQELYKRNIKLFIENSSVIDGFMNTVEDLRIIFDSYPNIGLLLDIAHINNYEHLKEIVKMRFPECLHIADKHFGIAHEHLPLGDGDLDFKMIFNDFIPNYNGKVILEATDSIKGIEQSKRIMDSIFTKKLI